MINTVRTFVRRHPDLMLLIVFLALLGLAHLLLDTEPTPLESSAALQARLTDGQPVVVEFYSNY